MSWNLFIQRVESQYGPTVKEKCEQLKNESVGVEIDRFSILGDALDSLEGSSVAGSLEMNFVPFNSGDVEGCELDADTA